MISKKKIFTAILCFLPISFVFGCSKIENDFKLNEPSTISEVELLNIVDDKNYVKYSNIIKDYNLGNVYLGDEGEKINIDLKGIIGIPKKIQNAPIIFIVSGNNNSTSGSFEYEETYKGFNYLVDSLSSAGFLTVAINTNMIIDESKQELIVEDKILNLVFEKHFDALKSAIKGKSDNFPVSLYNKGDLNNIGLVGQCNTGKTIFNISNEQVTNNNLNIKGLLSITPSSGIAISSYPDINTSILVTEHSSDTTIGFDTYHDISNTKVRDSFVELTYLIGGDSDKFNNLVNEDTLDSSSVSNNNSLSLVRVSNAINEDTIQDESSHEEFLALYSVDFFEYIFGVNIKNSLHDVNSSTIQRLYGKDILSKVSVKNQVELFNGGLESNIELNNVKSKNVVESSILSLDTAIDFNEPSTNIELNLIQLDWKSKNASLTIPVDNSNRDLSNAGCISIEWALNHASDLNGDDLSKVSLILEDNDGNRKKVLMLDEMPLNKITGHSEVKTIDEKKFSTWSRFTPVAESRISLELFEDIDLSNVKNITIDFEDNASGSIYLKNISIKK